jgi:hypothetical protein
MKIKFNWGTGIFITIILMVSWIGFLISKAFDYKINMDSDDYYERGLDHTQQMNRIKRSIAYQDTFKVEQSDGFIIIHYPEAFKAEKLKGELWFYRPSDFELDKKIAVSNQMDNSQKIHNQHFKSGRYILRATLNTKDSTYFFEREIIIK